MDWCSLIDVVEVVGIQDSKRKEVLVLQGVEVREWKAHITVI